MKRSIQVIAVVAVLGIVAAACGGDSTSDSSATPSVSGDLSGGTLKLAQTADVDVAFDPTKSYYAVTFEYYRCCLLRTLMSYNGKPTAEEGSVVRPDLAASDPEVSADGLTWTFKLKPGITYSPPFDTVQITAGDFITALNRLANPKTNVGGYSFYYSVIEGFDDYGAGKAPNISGLKAVDDQTLEVTLTDPAGDLGYRFSMPATAPIPPLNGEDLGVATGHDKDYGRFLVSSGPYMFKGSEALDFSVPAKDQTPVAGYVPGRSIELVRNPSWDPATDDLRKAYPDEIVTTIGGDNNDLYNKVDQGVIDLVVDGVVPPEKLKQYQSDPSLQDRLKIYPSDGVRYVSFNLAMAPFDDIHVRRAFNWVFDKQGFRQLRGGETAGELAGHAFVNSVEDNLLQDYDPFATPNGAGDLEKAQAEMAQSKYDTDKDGVCDDPSCSNILTMTDREDPYPKQAALLQQFLQPLGITLDVKELERTAMYNKCNDLNSQVAFCAGPGWFKDYADAYTFGVPLMTSSGLWESCCNYSAMGATPAQLKEWGYSVTETPSLDDKGDECTALTGDERVQCWADMDKQVMEQVVPWVPYLFDNQVDLLSPNLTNYSFDQSASLAAFDQLALNGSGNLPAAS